MSDPHLRFLRGGEARVLSFDGEAIRVHATISSPPGSRLEADVVSVPGMRMKMKVHGAKRQDDGSFVLHGRAFDLTREVRDAIMGLVTAGEPSV
jgi:hypothetical protein